MPIPSTSNFKVPPIGAAVAALFSNWEIILSRLIGLFFSKI
jgi:hypothetical protein